MKAEESPLPVELSDEPLVGWRCWFALPHELLLRPILKRGLAWKPREPVEAICPEHLHEVPFDDAEKCRCGIWTVCHPMLLDEIGWTSAPPRGVGKLPGIMVVGEVSLWGKIVQHARGWRASMAYPRHLYAFTDDPLIAQTLRERYGVPVEWGADAERLRQLLPITEEEKEEAPTLTVADALLAVVDAGLVPSALRALFVLALEEQAKLLKSDPRPRLQEAQEQLRVREQSPPSDRAPWRRQATMAAAEVAALEGDTLAAARRSWIRLVRWQRGRAKKLAAEVAENVRRWSDTLEDLARGTHGRTGKSYAATTLNEKRLLLPRYEEWIAKSATQVVAMTAIEIPTYREWRAMVRCEPVRDDAVEPALSIETLEAWHQAMMRRQASLAERERLVAVGHHRLIRDREAFETQQRTSAEELARDREALVGERAQLREEVVAGVRRDHAELLREVGELEARRRGALAMLPDLSPPSPHRRPSTSGRGLVVTEQERRTLADLRNRLVEAGITFDRVAAEAGVTRPMVSHCFAGRAKSQRVVETAKRLLGGVAAGVSSN